MVDNYSFYCILFMLIRFILTASSDNSLPPTCASDIYCYGPLLHTVQVASIFPDSKTFVDMKMKYGRNETLKRFQEMMKKTNDKPTPSDVKNFVNETFDLPGTEFETFQPNDWTKSPPFLKKIADPDLKKWASQLNELWKLLGRKMKDEVRNNAGDYSIIYVPNPVVVPGGRFREFYYWDSYWVIRGLLLSKMYVTVKGMIQNFLSIVESVGFVPNGGRIYYTMRSQPPLLIPMVKSYLDFTHDKKFLENSIATLEKEFQFWMSNRTVKVKMNGKNYTLARYYVTASGPRPESYREDILTAKSLKTESEKDRLYSDIKTAAESGWDFSSRWFILDKTNKGNVTNMNTRSIIPVDLNAIIYWNANLLAKFFKELKEEEKHSKYLKIAKDWLEAVTKVLWHDKIGTWLDYDIKNNMERNYYYASNIAPLWTGCYDIKKKSHIVSKVIKYLSKTGILDYPGGIPTSLEHTGEQWDYPNLWPPLEYIIIIGLDSTGDKNAKTLAYELAMKWIRSNYKGYKKAKAMYEKYDAEVVGSHGGGGEYHVQLGFGWTNGVCMELLDKYGHKLTTAVKSRKDNTATAGQQTSCSISQLLIVLTAHLTTVTYAAECMGFFQLPFFMLKS